MRKSLIALTAICALSSAFDTLTYAQEDKKARKQPKQTHDRGIDEPAAGALVPVEKNVDGLTVTFRADGTALARLDDSFDDATVAVRHGDGTYSYVCLHGLPVASQHVKSGQLEKTIKTATPTLEVK